MHRLEDNYNWKTLKHWRMAVKTGNVQIKTIEGMEITDAILENALKLLRSDCFPVSIICYRTEDNQKEIWLTPLWTGIFDFLDEERHLETTGGKLCFGDMEKDDQNHILNAQIASIWITGT